MEVCVGLLAEKYVKMPMSTSIDTGNDEGPD